MRLNEFPLVLFAAGTGTGTGKATQNQFPLFWLNRKEKTFKVEHFQFLDGEIKKSGRSFERENEKSGENFV